MNLATIRVRRKEDGLMTVINEEDFGDGLTYSSETHEVVNQTSSEPESPVEPLVEETQEESTDSSESEPNETGGELENSPPSRGFSRPFSPE